MPNTTSLLLPPSDMFSNASNFVMNQPTLIDNGRDVSALQLLSQYVAQGATHDSYAQDDAPKCHPDTRKQLLSDIKEWMLEPDKETRILYLHGPAGAGKSCIARSTCAQTYLPGFLAASFFFWRGSNERNNTRRLVATIAYQLAMLNNELAEHIYGEIQRDPRILYDAPMERQFRKLILDPCFCVFDKISKQLNGVIIIDGVDECVDKEAQVSVLELLATMVSTEGLPLGIFLTSRPELHLKEVWDYEDIAPVTQFISLSNIRNTSEDIRTVLQSGFSRILNDRRFKEALQSVHRPWPSWSDVETLVERSSGQFIYAATVMKFVSNRSRNPDAQLQILLALPACDGDTSPLADLDSLYHEILSRADDPARTTKVLSFLLAIMTVRNNLKTLSFFDSSRFLVREINADMGRQLLIVEQLMSLPRREAFLALNDLHALIDLRDCSPISFYHKSFHDFLLASQRSKEFYVDLEATHAEIVQSCAKLLCLPNYNTAEQHAGWLYSFFMCPFHMDASGTTKGEIHKFEQIVQRFIGTRLHINHVYLKDTFKLLGLRENDDLVEITEVLTGFRKLSKSTFNNIGCGLWILPHVSSLDEEISRIKESLICIPLMVAHLESYKMDLLTVKRSLAIHAIVPFSTLFKSGLCSTGVIHHLASLPEIQEDMIHSDLFGSDTPWFLKFLSDQRSSVIFSCTPEDFAEAYSEIINGISTAVYLNRQGCKSLNTHWERNLMMWPVRREYSDLLEIWTCCLHDINPPATPGFLAALKSAAQVAYDYQLINWSPQAYKAEEHLLEWLKNLPSPPHDIIDAWQKSFEK